MESHGSFSKAGHGEQATCSQKKTTPFSILLNNLLYPEGQHSGTCPLAARGESHGRAALGVAGLSPRPVVQPQGCHSARSCSLPASIPSHPAPLAGAGMQGPVKVRVPAVMLELCCIHPGIILAKRRFLVHKFSFPFWAREESREERVEPGGQETNLP